MKALHLAALARLILPLGDEPKPIKGFSSCRLFFSGYLVAKINALNPNPGTWFELNGIRIKILKAQEVYISGKPGEIIDNKLTIGCLENSLQILKLKKEGKNEMSSLEFLKGNKLKVGTILNGV